MEDDIMSHKTEAFAAMAQSMIKNLEKRNMEGYYFETSAECVKAITESIPQGSTIGWGFRRSKRNLCQNGSCGLLPDEHKCYYDRWGIDQY